MTQEPKSKKKFQVKYFFPIFTKLGKPEMTKKTATLPALHGSVFFQRFFVLNNLSFFLIAGNSQRHIGKLRGYFFLPNLEE